MTLVGMEHTLRQLARAPDVVKKHAAAAVGYSADRIAQGARAIVPVDTGFLKDHIGVLHTKGFLTGFVGVTEASAYYWYPLEVGHKQGNTQVAARPTFRTAAESGRAGFENEMRDIGPAIEHEMAEGRLIL